MRMLAASSDGLWLAVGCGDAVVQLRSIASGFAVVRRWVHAAPVVAVAFDPSSRLCLALCGHEMVAHDVRSDSVVLRLPARRNGVGSFSAMAAGGEAGNCIVGLGTQDGCVFVVRVGLPAASGGHNLT